MTQPAATSTRLVDVVFPGDTNHHGTLFGGVGLAHMDKVAFITAARFGRADFVTASCEQVEFQAPCQLGDIVELEGRVLRKGRRSVAIEVRMRAESPLSGQRRDCGRALFHMVSVGDALPVFPGIEAVAEAPADGPGLLRMVDLVFPGHTNHYGSLYGGEALSAMGKAAFVAASRHARQPLMIVASREVVLEAPIYPGEVMELVAEVTGSSPQGISVAVELRAEQLASGQVRRCGRGLFTLNRVTPGDAPQVASSRAW